MPELLWSLCCQRTLIDSRTNMLSLIDIIEQLRAPELPTVMIQMLSVVSLWKKDNEYKNKEETFKHRIRIELPLGTPTIPPIEYETIIPKDKARIRTLNGIGGIRINEEGTLYFIIELYYEGEWHEINKIQVEIQKIKK